MGKLIRQSVRLSSPTNINGNPTPSYLNPRPYLNPVLPLSVSVPVPVHFPCAGGANVSGGSLSRLLLFLRR